MTRSTSVAGINSRERAAYGVLVGPYGALAVERPAVTTASVEVDGRSHVLRPPVRCGVGAATVQGASVFAAMCDHGT